MTSETQGPLAAYPADERSLWTTSEGRVVYYFIDRYRTVSTLVPAQQSCWQSTQGNPFTDGTVDAIHEAMQRFNEQTPLTLVELETLPLEPLSGTIEDRGYDVLVVTGWDEDGAFHGSPAPPEGEVLSCIYLPPNASVGTVGVDKIQHEVGHNLGMQHEHQRSDRDESIVASQLPCAEVTPPLDNSRNLTPYDKTSIMHYGSTLHVRCPEWDYLDNNCEGLSCCTNADATCGCPHGSECRTLGGDDFSLEDINGLYEAYPKKQNHLAQDDRLGSAMASGDFDDDGYTDLAIGAPGAGLPAHDRSGVVFVYKGTYLGLMPWFTLAQEDGSDEEDDDFGAALTAGDVDGDGVADLVVGAPGKRASGVRAGRIYLYRGIKAVSGNDGGTPVRGGLSLSAARVQSSLSGGADHDGDRFGAALDIARVQPGVQVIVGAPGYASSAGRVYVLTEALALSSQLDAGQAAGSAFGTDVRAAQLDSSSFFSDLYDDLVVGAPGAPPGGKIYVYKGSSLGLLSRGSIEAEAAGISSTGGKASARFGTSIRLGHFYDGGAKHQIAVGAPGANLQAGKVSVIQVTLGRSVIVDQVQVLSTLGAVRFGQTLATGTLDGDSVSDLVVGAPDSSGGGTVFLYKGVSGSGPALQAWKTVSEPSSHGTPASGDRFGGSLKTGDFNHDGKDDLAIGVPNADRGGLTETGAAYFMKGRKNEAPVFVADEFDFTTYVQADSEDDVQKK